MSSNNGVDPQLALDTTAANVTLRGQIKEHFDPLMALFTERISLTLYQGVRAGSDQQSRFKAAFGASDTTHHLMMFLTAANAAVIRNDAMTLLLIIEEWTQKMEASNASSHS